MADFLDDFGDGFDGIEERVGFELFAVVLAEGGDADLMVGFRGPVEKAQEERRPKHAGEQPFAGPDQPRERRVLQQHAAQRLVLGQRDAVGHDEAEHAAVVQQAAAKLDEQLVAVVLPAGQLERAALQVVADRGEVRAPGRIADDHVEAAAILEHFGEFDFPMERLLGRKLRPLFPQLFRKLVRIGVLASSSRARARRTSRCSSIVSTAPSSGLSSAARSSSFANSLRSFSNSRCLSG